MTSSQGSPERAATFRDFGILPEGLAPPPDTIRSFLSTGRILGQYIGMGIAALLGLGLTALCALMMQPPLSILACAATLTGFGVFILVATRNDYRWVELQDNTLSAKHLYTGRTIKRTVDEIQDLGTMGYPVRGIETAVIESVLGRVKGVEIRFRDGRTPLRILRADPAMTNAMELIEALLYRMKEIRELDCEIVDVAGQPLVRSIHWRGEQPNRPARRNLRVVLTCVGAMTLVFGILLGFWGLQEQERRAVGSIPPREIAIRSLIQDRAGANRHVTVTDFRAGSYVAQSDHGSWTNVWVPLFPAAARPDNHEEIKVVLSSRAIEDEAALMRLLQDGRVTGICSRVPRTSWGATLGPELVKANGGRRLVSAWEIKEMRKPPGAAWVMGLLISSAVCLTAVMVLAPVIVRMAVADG
jgi:hypothetical protein